jgi:hypothetical protein
MRDDSFASLVSSTITVLDTTTEHEITIKNDKDFDSMHLKISPPDRPMYST